MIFSLQPLTIYSFLNLGFANLSTVDGGFFGKGIYLTGSVRYALPYVVNEKKNPALLVCFVVPGNVYPVIEDTNSQETLFGKPLQSGYQSHYVLTNAKGEVHTRESLKNEQIFDEIVCSQESQVRTPTLHLLPASN